MSRNGRGKRLRFIIIYRQPDSDVSFANEGMSRQAFLFEKFPSEIPVRYVWMSAKAGDFGKISKEDPYVVKQCPPLL